MRSELKKFLKCDPMKAWWFRDKSPEARQAWKFVFAELHEARKHKTPKLRKEVRRSLLNREVFIEYIALFQAR